ncbi:J domain-containing protein [Aspergillus mulundensis]|uniref:J domain-containing protein n=1 Tax=Aspergillus mulundensis TaxID=1810919 RepID=A0A3D8T3F7_9EURO|nr:hypothetical protein DSM5745_00392 [Aspergillus mulundensis]RDW93070.1 hypothetical protein DSM5745_00392 [Aspergillus mulundensis]
MNHTSGRTASDGADNDANDAEAYSLLMAYPEESDYYALLGLPRDPPPTDGAIRSAYRTLTLSFHPDKQPSELRDVAEQQFKRIQDAYESLIDPQKRVVYDLLGAEGVRREWGLRGSMGRGGELERQGKQAQVGVRAMKSDEFRDWFLEMMKRRERTVLNSMVKSKGSLVVGVKATDMITVNKDGDEVYLEMPSPKLSNFAVRYSFVTPFPSLQTVFGEDEKEDDEMENGEEAGKADKATGRPELEIYAGVAGGFQRLFNQVEFEYEDGETEMRNNITLGASTDRVITDRNPKGLLRRWPFSYFQNTLVSVGATALPETTLQANVTKSIVVTPGTKPFNVVLGTTFSRSIFEAPPMLNLQVTKSIGQKKTAFCSWSSGYLDWPLVIQTLFLPFVGEDVFLEHQEVSQLQVGIASQSPKLSPAFVEDDEEDVARSSEDEEEDEYEVIRARKREEEKAAEAWTVAISSSPVTNGIILKYSRNIFSGSAATDALSQWSSEKHYALPPANEPRSVRLDVNATVSMNLSLGWSIHGSRQVSELTRMGFGVSIQSRGLILSLSWARLGQRIRLPIVICAMDNVTADSATLVVLLPWLTYCAVEFGFIRPRERRNRRKLIAKRQKKLRQQIPRKRLESAQAIEIMADQVRRRQDKEYSRGGLVITKAEYGHYLSKRNADTEPAVTDVTIPVAALVDHGQLNISKKTAKFHILGFHDPAPLQQKTLKIWYQYHGKEHYVEANDAEGVNCPMRSHLVAA